MNTNEYKVSGRAFYTEDERRELIDEFNSSGLTQTAFCREWNINPKTWGRWLRVERNNAEISFCEVEVPPASSLAVELKIGLPNRIEIQIWISSLSELGAVLREAAGCLD